ncbi:hypothetical protein BU23DRAFT_600240 [Bimuria novae-zelandiae CBS 107.79]|uniref:Uncharacterized protein n=1 Tax=Bimuria novae-zelandiae CBS 107.79 TaxID=1447943 RepID=A0A6A5V5Q3_9PLEO|nr:hypothetical protein BU23DRAFT_600240 [Bimuria novae-zelandiae CBS 107.79]
MGRFETLKPETQDMVNAMLPAIATSFKVDLENFKDIIPQDIRMRQWDCERRDHIKDKSEDEPRNWGVEFLKSIQAIARLNGGDLVTFHRSLREKVAVHAEKHPWCRLEDIRKVKAELENPALRNPQKPEESESSSDDSLDSYLEELVDQDLPKGTKRGDNEAYESRVQGWWKAAKPKKPKKPVRLRRDENGGYQRRGKDKSKSRGRSEVSGGTDDPEPVEDPEPAREDSPQREPKRRRLTSKRPVIKEESPTIIIDDDDDDDDPPEAKLTLAELVEAEAELKVARRKRAYLQVKVKARAEKAASEAREASAANTRVSVQNDDVEDVETSHHQVHNGFSNVSGFTDRTGFRGFSGFGRSASAASFHGFNGFNSSNGDSHSSLQPRLPIRQGSQALPPADEEHDQESYGDESEDEK